MSKIAVTKEQQQVKLLEAKLTQANREVQQLELKIKAMHQQHEELQTKNANILKQSYAQQGALRDKDKHEEQVRTMAAELAVLRSQFEASKGSIKALQMEREHLIARYNDDQQQWEKLAVEFGEKEDQFRVEIEKCQEALDDKDHVIQQQKTDLLRQQQEIAEERRRLSRVGTELSAEQGKVQKLETALEDLTQEIAEMGMKLAEATNQLNEQLEITRRDRKEMQTLREKADYLNHRVEQLADESSRKDSIIADLKTDMLKRNGDIDDKDQSVRMAKAEMARLQSEIDRLTKLNEQRVQMNSRTDALLSDATAKLRAAEDDAIELKEKLRACELERMTFKDDAYKASVSVKQLTADLKELKDSLETKDGSARHLNEKIASLEKELNTERNLSAAAKTRLETQAELHKTQLETKTNEIQRLKTEINLQQEHIDRIQQLHNTVDGDRVALSNEISELKTLLATEGATNKQLSDKIKELEETLSSEAKTRADCEAQLVFTRNENASLHDEVRLATNDRDSLRGKLQACEDLFKQEQSKNRVASSDGIAMNLRIERLSKDLEHTQTTLEEVRTLKAREIEALEEELGAAKAKSHRIFAENNDLNNAARVYRDRCKALEKSLREAEDSCKKLGKEAAAYAARKDEYKNLARELTDRRDRENDFNTRLASFHKRQIAALKEHSKVQRSHIEGFVHFQKMVATAVAMSQSRMEDFVGEDVWNEVIAIQKSAEKQKEKADTESAELQKQYDALKAEYQSRVANQSSAAGEGGANIATGKENGYPNTASAPISATTSPRAGAAAAASAAHASAFLARTNSALSNKIAAPTTSSPLRAIGQKYSRNAMGDDDLLTEARISLIPADDIRGDEDDDYCREVSASVRPPTLSMQRGVGGGGAANNKQGGCNSNSVSTARSVAMGATRCAADDEERNNGADQGQATVSPSVHRSAAPPSRVVPEEAILQAAEAAKQRRIAALIAANNAEANNVIVTGDFDDANKENTSIDVIVGASPRALKRLRADPASGVVGGRLQSIEPAVVSRSPAPITPTTSQARYA